jgi:hypothetical protein
MTTVSKLYTSAWCGLVGLANTQIIRLQSIDYPFRQSLANSLRDTIKHDYPSVIWLGMAPILAGQYIFQVLLTEAFTMKHYLNLAAKRENAKNTPLPW